MKVFSGAKRPIADDGLSARADWVRSDDDGDSWRPWMRIELTRQPESG